MVSPQGEDRVPPPGVVEDVRIENQADDGPIPNTLPKNTNKNEAPKATSATCKLVAAERPKIELPSNWINNQI